MEKFDMKIIRFTNAEVLNDIDTVIRKIENVVKQRI